MKNLFDKLNEFILQYDNFIVMGHENPDLDSLGSALGFCEIIESKNKKAYLFLNRDHLEIYNNNINQAFDKMEKDIYCVDKNTYKKLPGNTLLIILDVHQQDRLEYKELLDEFDAIVIDHHIKSPNYIKQCLFMYLDSNLSSMCELVTYYSNYNNVNIDGTIATIMLGGIEIDTNSYNVKTTSKTYEASSLLMGMGADPILKQELLKESKEEYIKRADFIKNSFMIRDNIAMCILRSKCSKEELAEVAESLLTFVNVEASFSIGKLDSNLIGISARSLGKFNVEEIMVKFGGGGHLSNAAAQVKNATLREIKQQIKNVLEEKSENNIDK